MPMVVYTEEEMIEERLAGESEGAARCAEDRDRYMVALRDLVGIIDKAGLLNLSNGVQLGQTSWYVKASERLDYAKKILGMVSEPETL